MPKSFSLPRLISTNVRFAAANLPGVASAAQTDLPNPSPLY